MSLCSHGLPTRTHQEPDDYPPTRTAARLPSALETSGAASSPVCGGLPHHPQALPGGQVETCPRSCSRGLSTKDIGQMAQPGQPLFGINATNGGRIVIFAGGIPLTRDGEVVGAIGVSGGTVDQDHEVAEAGVAAFDRTPRRLLSTSKVSCDNAVLLSG